MNWLTRLFRRDTRPSPMTGATSTTEPATPGDATEPEEMLTIQDDGTAPRMVHALVTVPAKIVTPRRTYVLTPGRVAKLTPNAAAALKAAGAATIQPWGVDA